MLCLLLKLLQRGSQRQDELDKRKDLLLLKAKMRPDSKRSGNETKAFNSVLDQIEFWDTAVDAMVSALEKLVLITCPRWQPESGTQEIRGVRRSAPQLG